MPEVSFYTSPPCYDKVQDCWCVQVATEDDYELLCYNEFNVAYTMFLKGVRYGV